MKYFSRSNEYRASNVVFKMGDKPLNQDVSAWSYGWWQFVKVIDGKTVFNSYRYSSSTGKHQSKVRSLMDKLGLKIDMDIEVPLGFQKDGWKEDSIKYALYCFEELEKKETDGRPGTGASAYRKVRMDYYTDQINFLRYGKTRRELVVR